MYTKSVNKRGANTLRITHEADYAIRIVYGMIKAGDGPVPAAKLAERAGVTLRFALKILRKLTQSGIVKAQKGAAGGYFLAKAPGEISLGSIIESIDGPFQLNHCLSDDFDCTRVGDKRLCQFHAIFDRLSADLRDKLYSITMDHF